MGAYFEKSRKAYRYEFWFKGERYRSPRGFPTKREATDAEGVIRKRLRRLAAGLEVERPASPRFAEIAGAYLTFLQERGRDISTQERNLRVVLRFFGSPQERFPGEPYHDLRLNDVIDDASWILKFEEWMIARGSKGATRNRYRSACSRLYWFAMLPQYRTTTGITVNPFRGLLRDTERGRTVTLTPTQIRAIINTSPQWLALALAIATYAPKLRLSNILSLRWERDLDEGMTQFTIAKHKTANHTGRPLVAPISKPLRALLQAARTNTASPWVIVRTTARSPKGKPVTRRNTVIKELRAACTRVGITYGRQDETGATFHTIRHSAATALAALGVAEGLRKEIMGHLCITTTQKYTHLQPQHEVAPLELLGAVMEDQ